MELSEFPILSFIESLRHLLGDVGFGASLGALISAFSAFLNSWFQNRRDRKEWQREKLYELYSQAQGSLAELVRVTVMCDGSTEAIAVLYSVMGALNRLKLVSFPEHQSLISEAIEDLKVMQSKGGVAIPSTCRDDVYAIRERIFRLAQDDKRLGGLF